MDQRRSTVPRLCVVLLLLLVVSPVTAPFSTCDLLELFGGPASPGSGVHSKAMPDEPVAGAGGAIVVHSPRARAGLTVLPPVAQPRWSDAFHVPLRI